MSLLARLAVLLELSEDEFLDISDWLKERKIEQSQLISLLKRLLMEEIAK